MLLNVGLGGGSLAQSIIQQCGFSKAIGKVLSPNTQWGVTAIDCSSLSTQIFSHDLEVMLNSWVLTGMQAFQLTLWFGHRSKQGRHLQMAHKLTGCFVSVSQLPVITAKCFGWLQQPRNHSTETSLIMALHYPWWWSWPRSSLNASGKFG